ncbi:MAG: hypothetical protein IKT40_09070 [Bacilli bacterium]|nr:hypothetical protein [Bacilli bacterium]
MINNKLLKEIEEYCKFNNIEDINSEINKILRIGFNVVRFGVSPFKRFEEPIEEVKEETKPIEIKTSENVVKKKPGRKKKVVEETTENTIVVETQPIIQIEKTEIVAENNVVNKKVRIIKSK